MAKSNFKKAVATGILSAGLAVGSAYVPTSLLRGNTTALTTQSIEKTIAVSKKELIALERKAAIAKVDDALQTAKTAEIIKLAQSLRTEKVSGVNRMIQSNKDTPIAVLSAVLAGFVIGAAGAAMSILR